MPLLECGAGGPGEEREWRLIALGDIGLSGAAGEHADRAGSSQSVFEEITPALRAADCVIGNLETPLLRNWGPHKMFAGSTAWAPDLAAAGIDTLHLASNHMLDHGSRGFAETIEAVGNAGISVLGAGSTESEARRLVVRQIGSMRVGFLAAGLTRLKQPISPRLWELDTTALLHETERARSRVDLLIVSLHWGWMLVEYPHQEQYETAHRLVDAGASAVLMHHAHVLQGVEIYAGAPICYNLGNFLFDPDEGLLQKAGNFSHLRYERQVTGGVFSLAWRGGGFARLLVAPIRLPRGGRPDDQDWAICWAHGDHGRGVTEHLRDISVALQGDFSDLLEQQSWEIRRRDLALNLHLILKRREFWRIWYVLKRVRLSHCRAFCRKLLGVGRRSR